jgi:hypothetical protein
MGESVIGRSQLKLTVLFAKTKPRARFNVIGATKGNFLRKLVSEANLGEAVL